MKQDEQSTDCDHSHADVDGMLKSEEIEQRTHAHNKKNKEDLNRQDKVPEYP